MKVRKDQRVKLHKSGGLFEAYLRLGRATGSEAGEARLCVEARDEVWNVAPLPNWGV